jgi:hypothetical protein
MLVSADESIVPVVTPVRWKDKSNSLNNRQQCSLLMHVDDCTVPGDKEHRQEYAHASQCGGITHKLDMVGRGGGGN